MNLMELTALLTLDSSGFGKGLNGAKALLTAFTSKAISETGRLIKSMVSTGVSYNREMEKFMTNFTTMLGGNQQKAEGFVKWMEQFAFRTPFKMQDLADAGQTLLQFGLNTDQAKVAMKQLGDISLGNQQRFEHLSQIYGKVSSQGKLTAQTLNQMIKAGFNPLNTISQMTGKSMEQLRKEMSQGKITIDVLNQALQYATSEGGMFFNAMEKGAQTINGQLSTLEGKWEGLTGGMIEPFTDQLGSKVLPKLLESLDKVSEALLGVNETGVELPEVSNSLTTWMDNLMATWTDGIKEDDATVQAAIGDYKKITGEIKSAFEDRIKQLQESTDPMAGMKIEAINRHLARINAIEDEIAKIITDAQGKNLTPEAKSRIEELNALVESEANAIGKLTDANVTPWENFANTLGDLAVVTLNNITSFITDVSENWEDAALIIGSVAAAVAALMAAFAPSALLVIGVPAVVALIVTNWEKVKSLFEDIKGVVQDVLDMFSNPLDTAGRWVEFIGKKLGFLDGNGEPEGWNGGAGRPDMSGVTNERDMDTVMTESQYTGAGRKSKREPVDMSDMGTDAALEQFSQMSVETSTLTANMESLSSAVSSVDMSALSENDAPEMISQLATKSTETAAGLESVSAADDSITGEGIKKTGTFAAIAKGAIDRANASMATFMSYDGKVVHLSTEITGMGFLKSLPGRAVGIDYVPYNGYAASLHEGEMVLTKAEANRFRRGEKDAESSRGGSGIDYDRMASVVSEAVSKISLNLNGRKVGNALRRDIAGTQYAYAASYAKGVGK